MTIAAWSDHCSHLVWSAVFGSVRFPSVMFSSFAWHCHDSQDCHLFAVCIQRADEWPLEVSTTLYEITLSMRQLHKELSDAVSDADVAAAADADKIKCPSHAPLPHNLCET